MALFNTQMRLFRLLDYAQQSRAAYDTFQALAATAGLRSNRADRFIERLGFTDEHLFRSLQGAVEAGQDLFDGLFPTPSSEEEPPAENPLIQQVRESLQGMRQRTAFYPRREALHAMAFICTAALSWLLPASPRPLRSLSTVDSPASIASGMA